MKLARGDHPVFDEESTIVKAGNQQSPVDLQPWQSRIDKLAGKTLSNLPRLRITWGQDWAKATMLIIGRPRMKYCFWRYEEAGEIHDIGIPRFYVESLIPKSVVEKDGTWQKYQNYYDEDTGRFVDMMGPIPEDGFYNCVFLIAHHNESCCNGTGIQDNELCLGYYRPPCDSDLQRIRRIIWNRDHSTSDERSPSQSLVQKWSDEMGEKRDQQTVRASREYIDDFCRTHAWKWTEFDPSRLGWGKMIFTRGHSRSGATAAELAEWRSGKALASAQGFTVIDRRRIKEKEDDGSSSSAAA